MNVTGSRDFAHRSAANIGDPLSRAGLAEKFREFSALAAGTITGLADGADDNGVCVDSGANALLLLLRDLAAEAAEKIQGADVFVSCREAEQRLRDKLTEDDERAADPWLALRASGLDEIRAAHVVGVQHEAAYA